MFWWRPMYSYMPNFIFSGSCELEWAQCHSWQWCNDLTSRVRCPDRGWGGGGSQINYAHISRKLETSLRSEQSLVHAIYTKAHEPICYARKLHKNSNHPYCGIALGFRLDDREFKSRQGLGILLFSTASRTALGPVQPPIQWVRGALSLGVNPPGREADHSPPSRAEVKEWMELYLYSPNMSSWRGA
jgi:hypothetical protein